ncbi:hypothetical protein Bhyg_04039, partial [Pseudolycoriella hygida]
MEIVSYLPTAKKVALVNKRFYAISCAAHVSKFTLSIDCGLIAPENLVSIVKTRRKISNIHINFTHLTLFDLGTMRRILKIFQNSVRYVQVSGQVNSVILLGALALLPNVQHLTFVDTDCMTSFPTSTSRRRTSLGLKVKTIEFVRCNNEVIRIMLQLAPGVLTDLTVVHSFNLHMLLKLHLFKNQQNIKNLTIIDAHAEMLHMQEDESHLIDDILGTLSLETFEFKSRMNANNIAEILSKQEKLKCLRWTTVFHEDLMPAIKHLANLETLTLNVAVTPVEAIANINKLKNLNHLVLHNFSREYFDAFSKLDNSQITILEIKPYGSYIESQLNVELIYELAMSVRNLKTLKLSALMDWKHVAAILRNFSFVEELYLLSDMDVSYDTKYSLQNISFNSKLTLLSIGFGLDPHFLSKIIADYPNLKTFETRTGSAGLHSILKGFKKLEHFNMLSSTELKIDDIASMRKKSKNLQFVLLQ